MIADSNCKFDVLRVVDEEQDASEQVEDEDGNATGNKYEVIHSGITGNITPFGMDKMETYSYNNRVSDESYLICKGRLGAKAGDYIIATNLHSHGDLKRGISCRRTKLSTKDGNKYESNAFAKRF